jgi:hypothetical protein
VSNSAGFEALRQMREQLRRLPEMQSAVATKAAPEITSQAVASFDAGTSVYGDPRPPKQDGSTMTLHKTGALRAGIKFEPVGTKMRCVLSVKYARYKIKFGILPRGGQALPTQWEATITKVAADEFQRRMGSV